MQLEQVTPGLVATGYRADDTAIRTYYQRRGGERTFGQPVSNVFLLWGVRVQMFQRHILQVNPDGTVSPVNLLDELFPYSQVNGSSLPPPDPALAASAPAWGAPDYGPAVVRFVEATAPNDWQGLPVGFGRAFHGMVTLADAFPDGTGDPSLLPLLNLEVLGLPISAPALDPTNHGFVYQRFQRVVLHYDAATGKTQPLLLADSFKALLTGQGLPPDLEAEARASPFYRQYQPGAPGSLARPWELPGTDLTGAFDPADVPGGLAALGTPVVPSPDAFASATATPTPIPLSTADGAAPALPAVDNPSACQGDERLSLADDNPRVGDELVIAATSAKPHVFVRLTGSEKATPLRDGPRLGQLGYVWEWSVTPTYNGGQRYTFFIDTTVPCASIAFAVRTALATATPKPTRTPTATRTPTETATPTPTGTPAADPARSLVRLSTSRLRGDNRDALTVTATLLDQRGQPVQGVLVRVEATARDDADTVSVDQGGLFTDGQGAVQAVLTACHAAEAGGAPPPNDTVTVSASVTDAAGKERTLGRAATLTVVGASGPCA